MTNTKYFFTRFFALSCILFTPFEAYTKAHSAPIPKLSVQLHSVRGDVSKDFKSTLKKIAEIGFSGIEFAGRYGPYDNDPIGLKNFLKELGLEVSGVHISLSQLTGSDANKHLAFFKALGTEFIIIPFDSRASQSENIDEFINELKQVNKRVRAMDMYMGYHNHSSEFETFKEESFWDYIAINTPDDLILQLDVGWATFAGVDPVEYVKRFPQRTLTTHFKIRTYKGKPGVVATSHQVILGEDNFDWKHLIESSIEFGNTRWIVVEQEEYPIPLSPMQAVEASFNGISAILHEVKKNRG
jgi:sugar phosphate isomerase/epimerase